MIKVFLIRSVKILAILIGILALVAFAVPKFVNLNQYSQNIINDVESRTGNKILVNGEVSLSILPQIKIIIPNISVYSDYENKHKDIVAAKKVVLTMSIHRFLWGDRKIDSVELQGAKINRDGRSDSLTNLFTISNELKLKSLTITDSLSYSQSSPEAPQYTQMNIKVNFKGEEGVRFSGSIFKDSQTHHIEAKLAPIGSSNLQNVDINISSADADVVFQGEVNQEESLAVESLISLDVDHTWEIDGSIKIEVRNPSRLVKYFMKVMPFLSEMEKKSLENPIKLFGKVLYKKNFLNITDISISSDHTNGSGSLSFAPADLSNMKLKFDFEDVDINQFLSFSKKKEFEVSENEVFIDTSNLMVVNNSYLNFGVLNQEEVSLKLTAKRISIQKVSLENFNLHYNIKDKAISNSIIEFNIRNNELNSKFLMSNFKFDKIAGTTVLLGQFSNDGNNINKTLELFNLRNYINIQEENLNYSVSSKIIFAPKEISIFGIDGSIGEDGKMSGSIATKQGVISDYKVNLKVSNLKLVNFELPLFKSRLESLLKDSDDDRYLSKFIWFRALASTYDIKFTFENAELQNRKIENLTVLCKLAPSNMSIRGKINSSFANSNFSLDLTAFTIKPSLAIKISGKNLDYNVLDSLMFDFLKSPVVEENQSGNGIWSEQIIKPFSIYKYAAKFDIGIKTLKINKQTFKNFKFEARTASDSLYVDNLEMDLYGGKFQTRGNISFFRQILCQFSFSGSDLEVKDLLTNISPKINAFQGAISLNGSIVAGGKSEKELINSLNISSNFISSSININGLNTDKIIDIALKREEINKDEVLDSLTSYLKKGVTETTEFKGSLKGEKGVIESNNITFSTRFTSSITAMYLDLNNMILSSNSKFLFLPYNDSNPISYNILIRGDLEGELQRTINDASLLKYVKKEYDIVTAEDILEARRRNKQIARKQSNIIDSPNDKNYLYYKLQEQARIKKEKAEEAAELKKLNASNLQ